MKRYLVLIAWVVGILFPIVWIGKLSPGLRSSLGPVMRPLISPEWVHVIAHLALFSGLVLVLAFVFRLPRSFVSALFLFAAVAALGLGQEFVQLYTKQRAPGWPELFDLMVDLSGGLIGWVVWGLLMMVRRVRLLFLPAT